MLMLDWVLHTKQRRRDCSACRLVACRSGELTVLTTSYNGPSLSGNIVATLSSAVSSAFRGPFLVPFKTVFV